MFPQMFAIFPSPIKFPSLIKFPSPITSPSSHFPPLPPPPPKDEEVGERPPEPDVYVYQPPLRRAMDQDQNVGPPKKVGVRQGVPCSIRAGAAPQYRSLLLLSSCPPPLLPSLLLR